MAPAGTAGYSTDSFIQYLYICNLEGTHEALFGGFVISGYSRYECLRKGMHKTQWLSTKIGFSGARFKKSILSIPPSQYPALFLSR